MSAGDDKLSFRMIVLEHLRGVLGITIRAPEQFTFSYSQAVLSLSDVMLPFYDDEMESDYKKYEVAYKELKSNSNTNESEVNKIYRDLFRSINGLLSRNNYMKAAVYVEDE